MVESVKAKAERSIFSIKKGTILSDLIPRLMLPHEPLFARIDEQTKNGDRPHFLNIFFRIREKWGLSPFFSPIFLRYGDSVDLRRL